MSSIVFNLISAAIAATVTWIWQKVFYSRRRQQRLRELQEAAASGEVALCLRVGGSSDPLLDIREYLRTHHPEIKQLICYQVTSEDARGNLDNPKIANRIIEDIYEGIRAYGKGKLSRVHFFPAGMIVYPLIVSAMLKSWCPVVVYHKTVNTYVPLYEINRDRIEKGKRDFKPLKTWSTQEIAEPTATQPALKA